MALISTKTRDIKAWEKNNIGTTIFAKRKAELLIGVKSKDIDLCEKTVGNIVNI